MNNILVIVAIFIVKSTSDVIIQTNNGKILGDIRLNYDNQSYYSFQSIPYAKPPINDLRFKATQKAGSWKGTLNATIPSPMCPQFYYYQLFGQEDCLYLNVYTKSIDKQSKLPVMVYIHGGSYQVGSGSSLSYGPEFLLTEDIVLVTINYRLGYLGSLNFLDQTQGVPGNANLKDQVMALRWVQENIELFGGDKNLVTIFGESVGGASVHMHMLSPMSKGLVHRIIAQSGNALSAWNRGAVGTGEKIAKIFGISSKSTSDLITQLQKIPVDVFVKSTQSSGAADMPVDVPGLFSPIVETQTNEPSFITKPLINMIPEASNNVPLLIGYNNNDTLLFQVMNHLYQGSDYLFSNQLNTTIPSDLDLSQQQRSDIIASIRNTFFQNGQVDLSTNIGANSEFAIGPWFVAGLLQSIQKHLQANHEFYVYIFSSDTRLNYLKKMHPITAMYPGACHMDELGYLFTTSSTPCFNPGSIEGKSFRRIVKVWANFARYGKPTGSSDLFQAKKVTDATNVAYLSIVNDNIVQSYEPHKKVWDFWRNIYKTYKRVAN